MKLEDSDIFKNNEDYWMIADNIKGIEGIGPKKAQALLENCHTEQAMFNAVREAYGNDEEFIMNASVLWIMRHEGDVWRDRFNAYI